MGNTESNERQLFIGVILQLLSKREIKVKKSTIQLFFSFVQEQCPWFPEKGTVNLEKLLSSLIKPGIHSHNNNRSCRTHL